MFVCLKTVAAASAGPKLMPCAEILNITNEERAEECQLRDILKEDLELQTLANCVQKGSLDLPNEHAGGASQCGFCPQIEVFLFKTRIESFNQKDVPDTASHEAWENLELEIWKEKGVCAYFPANRLAVIAISGTSQEIRDEEEVKGRKDEEKCIFFSLKNNLYLRALEKMELNIQLKKGTTVIKANA